MLRDLKEEMMRLSEELRFEEAEELKQKYIALESFVSGSEVVSHTINDVDVFSITSDEKMAFINYIHVSNGNINQSFTIEYKKKLNDHLAQCRSVCELRPVAGRTLVCASHP